MCGICAFSLRPDADVDAVELARRLLLGIEHRGRDATGISWWGPKQGALCFDRRPVTASRYVRNMPLSQDSKTFIGHTRLATQGTPERNRNNHPVRVGLPGTRIIGVHNGMVWDRWLWRDNIRLLSQQAEVDTEALFAYIWENMGEDGSIPKDMSDVSGSYAVAYLREDQPGVLHLARGSDSPMVLAYSDAGVFMASTEGALKDVEDLVGPFYTDLGDGSKSDNGTFIYSEGRYARLEGGQELCYTPFEADRWSSYRSQAASNGRCTECFRFSCSHDDDDTCSVTTLVTSEPVTVDPTTDSTDEYWDGIPEYGYDYRVSADAIWIDTFPCPTIPDKYYHCYDDGSFVYSANPKPPFWQALPAGMRDDYEWVDDILRPIP